jgi:hypothetical protein
LEAIISYFFQFCWSKKRGSLYYLLDHCSLEHIEKILSDDGNFDYVVDNTCTLLTYAASLEEPKLLNKVLKERPSLNLDEKDKSGRTALESAVKNHADSCLQLLIEKKPEIFTTPIEENATILSLIETAVEEDNFNAFTLFLNKINDIAPSKSWLKQSWFQKLIITALIGLKGNILSRLLLPPVNYSIADIENFMPVANQVLGEKKRDVRELLSKRSLSAIAEHVESKELFKEILKLLPHYSIVFFELISASRCPFQLSTKESKKIITNIIPPKEKDVAVWKQDLISASGIKKHRLNYQISMTYYWLSVAYVTLAFYNYKKPEITSADDYIKASQYFLKAENFFKNIPESLASQDKQDKVERENLIIIYRKSISRILLKEIKNRNKIQLFLSALPQFFLNFHNITCFDDVSICIGDTIHQYRFLEISDKNSLMYYIEKEDFRRTFDEYNFKKPGSWLFLIGIQNNILGFLASVAVPEKKEKETTRCIVNFKQEMKRSIPAYIYRMAKACSEQLALDFNTKDIQEMLDTALWQRRNQHELTILNYAELQKYLLNAIELWKDFIWGKKLSRQQAGIQLSACLTQVVTHYLNHQQLIKALVIEAQGDRNSTYDQCLRQALIEGLIWHLRYMPHSELKQASSQLTNHLQKKLAQCQWKEAVSGKFFAPPKTTGLKLVYGNQLLFPGDPKALAQFIFADLPVVINNKKQFKALLTTHAATSSKRKKATLSPSQSLKL